MKELARAALLALVSAFPLLNGCTMGLPMGNLLPGSPVPPIGVNQLPQLPQVPQFPQPPQLGQLPQLPPGTTIVIVLRGAPMLPGGLPPGGTPPPEFPPPPAFAPPGQGVPAGTGLYDPGPSYVGPTRELTPEERVLPAEIPVAQPPPPPATPRVVPGEMGLLGLGQPPVITSRAQPAGTGSVCTPGGG